MWGLNYNGQVGTGANGSDVTTPTQISIGGGKTLTALAAGYFHSGAVASDGSIYLWGFNQYGQLGTGDTVQRSNPTAVDNSSSYSTLSLGFYHSGGIKGKLLSLWGYNGDCQIYSTAGFTVLTPFNFSLPSSATPASLSLGGHHTGAIDTNGLLYMWGLNTAGQLGTGNTTTYCTPTLITFFTSAVAKIALGDSHSCSILSSQALYCWGDNSYGQLGDGTTGQRSSPTMPVSLSGALEVSPCFTSTVALSSSNAVYAWGQNTKCQLGSGSAFSTQLTPQLLPGLHAALLVTVGSEAQGSCAYGY
eukprot:TRINITY_DN6456_c0_g1_i1.p1 TRINITY_DN6456_c0_g1~~TRINITY_DN6456_c0_g1_i1.p1  ORF type:complete len:304 (-),score=5.93 TRINITY_DN6456_c0_g1_i1:259-1170(-)